MDNFFGTFEDTPSGAELRITGPRQNQLSSTFIHNFEKPVANVTAADYAVAWRGFLKWMETFIRADQLLEYAHQAIFTVEKLFGDAQERL